MTSMDDIGRQIGLTLLMVPVAGFWAFLLSCSVSRSSSLSILLVRDVFSSISSNRFMWFSLWNCEVVNEVCPVVEWRYSRIR